jgi:hypothetical protein
MQAGVMSIGRHSSQLESEISLIWLLIKEESEKTNKKTISDRQEENM